MENRIRHASKPARFLRATQALAGVCLLVLLQAGCARAPRAGSGTAARDRFLTVYASPHGPTRGVGSISVRRGSEGRGGARARWGGSAEILSVAGYVGPARVFDGSLRGDSLLLVLRRYGMGVTGNLSAQEGVDGRTLRFAATPWDFSAPRVKSALERAAVTPTGEGWKLAGVLGAGDYRFALVLSERGEPRSLAIGRDGEERDLIAVRYGPERNYTAGRIPSWIEWSFSGSVVTLQVEDHAPADPDKIRYGTSIQPEWTILSLDGPAGRNLIAWLLGLSEGGTER